MLSVSAGPKDGSEIKIPMNLKHFGIRKTRTGRAKLFLYEIIQKGNSDKVHRTYMLLDAKEEHKIQVVPSLNLILEPNAYNVLLNGYELP